MFSLTADTTSLNTVDIENLASITSISVSSDTEEWMVRTTADRKIYLLHPRAVTFYTNQKGFDFARLENDMSSSSGIGSNVELPNHLVQTFFVDSDEWEKDDRDEWHIFFGNVDDSGSIKSKLKIHIDSFAIEQDDLVIYENGVLYTPNTNNDLEMYARGLHIKGDDVENEQNTDVLIIYGLEILRSEGDSEEEDDSNEEEGDSEEAEECEIEGEEPEEEDTASSEVEVDDEFQDAYEEYSFEDLKALAKRKGLDVTGTRKQVTDRLVKYENENNDDE